MWLVSRSVLTQFENTSCFMLQSYWPLTDPRPASFFLKKPRMAPFSCPWKRKRFRIAYRVIGWFHINQQPISSVFLAGFSKYIETGLKSSLKTNWSVLVLLLCCWLCRLCWNEMLFFFRKCRKDFANDMLLQNASNELSRKTAPDW